jgi:hypothetical protein
MQKISTYLPLLLLATVAACGPSTPTKHEQAGKIGSWQIAVSGKGSRDMICYAGTKPIDSEGTATKRASKPFLMATRRLSGKIEISASAGYVFKTGSKVELAVDGDSYSLFNKGAVAWARSDQDDLDIIEAMEDGEKVQVRGLSQNRRTSVDTYSPTGFAQAIERIRELCP